MNIAIVGCTGMVGRKMLEVLGERGFTAHEIIPVASARSCGKKVSCFNENREVVTLEDALQQKPDAALFSAGAEVSKIWAPRFAGAGTYVIDNSSAWRMDDQVPLVVPEINSDQLDTSTRIIANPNCSTIQLVMALYPLHLRYGLKRVVVSTYQSVTGSGMKGKNQLFDERDNKDITGSAYPHRIDLNLIPHGGDFLDNGYTTEEMKLVNESRKIMGTPGLNLTATVVRVPVTGGHSESVNIEFDQAFDLEEATNILKRFKGVVIQDDPGRNQYPMPMYAENKDEVFVGRLRRDLSVKNGLNLWVVSDNLRKGAATNAVQVLEGIIEQGIIS